MRIAAEIGWGQKEGGARRVAIKTLLEMVKINPDHQYLVYSNTNHEVLNKTIIRQIQLSSSHYIPQILWDQIIFPHFLVPLTNNRFKPDVIHHTNNVVSCWGSTPSVATIYDMTPFIIPEFFVRSHAAYQRAYFRFAAKKAAKIITVSENSKRDICRILKVDEEKVIVIPLASDFGEASTLPALPSVDLISRFNIRTPFVLYVGAIHPRKNVPRIIEAFNLLKQDKKIPHQLVIAGSLRWKKDHLFGHSSFNLVRDHIVFTGRVSEAELVSLYRNCDAFVWPSLYEGFGLPVLEAMSLGAPVVTSNCSSLPEVAGDAAVLVDPYNVMEIANAIWMILDRRSFAEDLRKKGIKRAAEFSWKKTAEKVLNVLESVV